MKLSTGVPLSVNVTLPADVEVGSPIVSGPDPLIGPGIVNPAVAPWSKYAAVRTVIVMPREHSA